MGFVFRFSYLNVLLLGLILSFHGFLLVQSQQGQAQPQSPPPPIENTSPPPPPPPPASSPPSPPPVISKSPPRPRAQASPPLSNNRKSPSRNQPPRRLRLPSPPPPPPRIFKQSEKSGLNSGKTVGLVFAGFAAMLQICIVAFLVFKRKQLLRMTHTY